MKLKRSDYNPEPKYAYQLQYALGKEIYCVRGNKSDDIDFGIGQYGCANAKLFSTIDEAKKMLADILDYAYKNLDDRYIPGSYYDGKKLEIYGKFFVSKTSNPNHSGWGSKMPVLERESGGKNYTLDFEESEDRKKKSTKPKPKRKIIKKCRCK